MFLESHFRGYLQKKFPQFYFFLSRGYPWGPRVCWISFFNKTKSDHDLILGGPFCKKIVSLASFAKEKIEHIILIFFYFLLSAQFFFIFQNMTAATNLIHIDELVGLHNPNIQIDDFSQGREVYFRDASNSPGWMLPSPLVSMCDHSWRI